MAGNAVVGALRVSLSLNTAAFVEGLNQSQVRLKKFGGQMATIGQQMTTRISAPIAAAAGGVVAALGTISTGLADIRQQAQIGNAGIEEFQRWAAGAKTVGIEQDKLADILKDVNDRVGDFMQTGGGPMADFFEKIAPKVGVTAEQFAKLSGPEALQLYVSSLEKAGVSQQDMTFYLEAMASDATALIPLLANNGAEMQKLGDRAAELGLATEGTVESSVKFQQSLEQLAAAGKGLGIALLESGIIDAITSIVTQVTNFVAKIREVDPDIVKFGVAFAGLAAAVGPVLTAVGLMVAAVAAIGAPVALAVAAIAGLTAGLVAFWPEIVAAKDGMVQFATEGIDWVKQKFEELLAYIRGLPAQFAQIGKDIADGLIGGLQAKWQGVKDSISGLGTSMANWFRESVDSHSPSRVFAEIGRDVMDGLQVGLDGQQDGIQRGVEGFAQDLASNFKGVLTGAQSFGDALKSTLSSAISSYSSNLLSSGINGLFGALKIPGFATGTQFAPGGLAMVGERGPELVNLPQGSKVYNAARTSDMLSGGSSAASVTQNFNFAAMGDDSVKRIIRQEAPRLAEQAKAAVIDAKRRGTPGL